MADTPSAPSIPAPASLLNNMFRSSQTAMALGIVTILMVLILPLPTWLLDIGLAISIIFSVMILMTVLFIARPLDFSSFPSVLLISTLLRLSLNLASTRLILSHGHEGPDAAGEVIEAFSGFVMSGNFVIGLIVFAILTLVNFVVITKGSGRIAEVSARFSLDAMPGKQMAIDADMSSGLIDEDTARKRRRELEQESNFYGSMDGAAKFVRGDAVAGLVIVFVNIIGGIIIGVVQKDMSFLAAADSYIRLTVGDGLVTQIPALFVSVAAGLLVTKAVNDVSGEERTLVDQIGNYPAAMGLSAGLMAVFALLPGMPFLPFITLAAIIGYVAYTMNEKRSNEKIKADQLVIEKNKPAPVAEEPIATALSIDLIRLELGYGLVSLVNSADGARLTDQIKGLRRQMAGDLGFVMPSVRIQDNLQLPANTYLLRVKEIEAGRGELRMGMLLVMDPRGDTITLPGENTMEPAFGLPAMWVDQSYREEALFKGYTVVDPPTVITTHLTEIIKDHMSDLLSYTETQKLLDELGKEQQKLVADVIPSQITIGGLQRVLQNLLGERVSIRDLSTILEGVAEAAAHTRNLTMITEHVRTRLARQISDSHVGEGGFVPIVTLSPEWEQNFAQAIVGDGDDRRLTMAPSQLQQFINTVRQTFDRYAQMGENPVLLTSPGVRPYIRSIIERFRPSTAVMSQNEIHAKAKIKTLGQI
jgi:flagellar biosynthesis protein FlhA